MRPAILVIAAGFALQGCAAPVIGAVTIGEISTMVTVASLAFSGKGLTEHALDAATGKDCRFIDGALRSDRNICEDASSPALDTDFKGLASIKAGRPRGPHARVTSYYPEARPEGPDAAHLASADVRPAARGEITLGASAGPDTTDAIRPDYPDMFMTTVTISFIRPDSGSVSLNNGTARNGTGVRIAKACGHLARRQVITNTIC